MKDILNELAEEISSATEEAGRYYEDLYDDIIRWIRSRDPVRAYLYRSDIAIPYIVLMKNRPYFQVDKVPNVVTFEGCMLDVKVALLKL